MASLPKFAVFIVCLYSELTYTSLAVNGLFFDSVMDFDKFSACFYARNYSTSSGVRTLKKVNRTNQAAMANM